MSKWLLEPENEDPDHHNGQDAGSKVDPEGRVMGGGRIGEVAAEGTINLPLQDVATTCAAGAPQDFVEMLFLFRRHCDGFPMNQTGGVFAEQA